MTVFILFTDPLQQEYNFSQKEALAFQANKISGKEWQIMTYLISMSMFHANLKDSVISQYKENKLLCFESVCH